MLKKLPLILLFFAIIPLSGCEFKDVELERVDDVKLESLQGGQIDGTIFMVLHNPNSFNITVKSADFDLQTGNVKLGNASLRKAFKIEANSTQTYPVQLSGNLSNALAGGFVGLAGLLSGTRPKVTIKGELKAGNFFFTKKVPIELDTELPVGLGS